MKYFIANLVVHVLVLLLLIALIVVCTNRNKRGATKHSLTYFMPFLLSMIAVGYLILYVAPRFLDLNDIINQNYYSYTGFVDEISPLNNYIVIDGITYYVNPTREFPDEGSYVKIKYTSYGHYAIEVESYEEVNVDDSVIEEMQTANNDQN